MAESRVRALLEEQLRFEKLMAHISSRFLQVDAEEIDAEIQRMLASAGEVLGGDRCFIFLLDEEGARHRISHVWTADQVPADPEVEGAVVQQAFPWLGARMLRHEDIVVHTLEDIPAGADLEREYARSREIHSFLMCPMYSQELVVGNIGLDMVRRSRRWDAEDSRRLRLVGEVIAGAVVRTRKEREIRALKDRLEAENLHLRKRISLQYRHEEIVGESEVLRDALQEVEQVAPTDSIVLLQGETGTGKELFARAVHRLSTRSNKPMVSVNCAALAPTLIESELFGREKGAYTGALSMQVGRFELADGTTIFLDEVGELPGEVQAKLLRVLETGEFERLGSTKTRSVDARVVAATNRDLASAVGEGSFRKDLYYRLNVYPIAIPPLCKRAEDIPSLVWAFVKEFEQSMGRRIEGIPDRDLQALQRYSWPGNVRELRNLVERSMIRERSTTLHIHPPEAEGDAGGELSSLEDMERSHILAALERTGWRIRGKGGAALILDLKPTTLESRMARLGIRRKP